MWVLQRQDLNKFGNCSKQTKSFSEITRKLPAGANEINCFENYDIVQQMDIDDVYEVGYLNEISLLGD